MRFASLGSGSRGNAHLVQAGETVVLVDCGFSARETERRLARAGCHAAALAGIVLTHEHGDHVRGVARLARVHGLPVWATAGTYAALGAPDLPTVHPFVPGERFAVGDLEIGTFPVPHDAREPAQLVFSDGARRLGVLTDTGSLTPTITGALARCQGLILECNHDPRMLADGDYPPVVKQRVAGPHGHLSNAQAAECLAGLDTGALQHLVGAHLSEANNTPLRARSALAEVLGCHPDWIAVADQADGLGWRALD